MPRPLSSFWIAGPSDASQNAHHLELVTARTSHLALPGLLACRFHLRATFGALELDCIPIGVASTEHGAPPCYVTSYQESTRGATVKMVILDGPIGTELARRGVPTPAPAWSAHALEVVPGAVASIHREYAAAGATVHTANTFRVRRRILGQGWKALAQRAVRLARDSALPGQRVAGSIGPIEDCYRADLSPGAASRGEHAELARALADLGVDLLLCETFPHAGEAAIAVREAVRTGVETWVALTAGPDASLMTPNAMGEAARLCAAEGARVVLVNCTPAVRTLAFVEAIATAGVGFGAYANAGSTEDRIGWQTDEAEGAANYARLAREWVAAGATVVGGCCGTGPGHIRALAALASFSS